MNEKPVYRKSPWRFAFLALAILAGLNLFAALFPGVAAQILLEIYEWSPSGAATSVGIIGGADGPTSIFVSTVVTESAGFDWDLFLTAVIFVIGIVGFLRLRKCKPKQ